ncbi:hypothetical protein MUP77_13235 [Candidatus Bathyarchaeota archaeon]|nr:hypothetical protein [Candidatus Bathyarchaeota archaeon]
MDLVKKKAQEKNIKYVIVASTRGETGVKAVEVFKETGINIVVVTHQVYPGGPVLHHENEKKIMDLGGRIVTCTFAFGGVASSLRRVPPRNPSQPLPQPYWRARGALAYVPSTGDLIANVLRLFSQGMKVCVEITVMATDAGAIPIGQNVIAVGGQGRGANTAIVIKSASTSNFFDLDIQEIIAKPIKKLLPRQ